MNTLAGRRAELKGHLFEAVILELLENSGFGKLQAEEPPQKRVRELRRGFVEIRGRGCWHQIDCPCDYMYHIPFLYPLRLLGEVKFYKKPLHKEHIRSFIGIIKDIDENYFVSDDNDASTNYYRTTNCGVFFSANGFQKEAEKLAYAHGIKTVSYENNVPLAKIKELIVELVEKHLSKDLIKSNDWVPFKLFFTDSIRNGIRYISPYDNWFSTSSFDDIIQQLYILVSEINSSFIGTTCTGVFIHFIGRDSFPEMLFNERDENACKVHWEIINGARVFWLTINNDPKERKFYFTPPSSLRSKELYGKELLNEKEKHFKELYVNRNINHINRNLVLKLDRDWLASLSQ